VMGVAYKAKDIRLDRFVAVKVLRPEKVADVERKRRFVQEAKAASALNHPNIITIHDIARGVDFIAMEYVAGKALDQLISPSEAPKYAVQIADALAAGIIHRDLKPAKCDRRSAGARFCEGAGFRPSEAVSFLGAGQFNVFVPLTCCCTFGVQSSSGGRMTSTTVRIREMNQGSSSARRMQPPKWLSARTVWAPFSRT
jgi:Protein kinase domain